MSAAAALVDACDPVFTTRRSRLPNTSATEGKQWQTFEHIKLAPSRTKERNRATFSVNFTCCNITDIPNSQAILLPPKGVDERLIRAARGTEQHALSTGGEVSCYNSFNDHKLNYRGKNVTYMFLPFSYPVNAPCWACCPECPKS